ncbi:MAG TPA: porin family protein [Nitrospiraceae bacterium]|nr:porin family protein [Nitrospiraceae bacterium]
MNERMARCLRILLVLFSLVLVLAGTQAQAEMYVAGQVGVTLPQDAEKIDYSSSIVPGVTLRGNDLELDKSVMYGAKLGYYFDSLKWLGLETEVFNTTPHLKQQNVTIAGISLGEVSGSYLRVLNWAPVNVVVRYQMGRLEPYAGIGLGLFFARLKDGQTGESTSSNATPGINTQVGLRYRVTQNFAIFGEWKYNYARFNFDETPTAFSNIDATYRAHHLVFGVGYHF